MVRAFVRAVGAKLAPVWANAKAVAMSMALAASMTLPALASENNTQPSTGGDLSTIISATDTITTMVGKAWTLMTGNPLIRVSLAAGLLSMGIGFLAFARRAARH